MKSQQIVKLSIVLILCTAYIFSFSKFGAMAFNNAVNPSEIFGENTVIASTDISGLDRSGALEKLAGKTAEWSGSTKLVLKFKEKVAILPSDLFTFDLEQSVGSAVSGGENLLIANIEEADIKNILSGISPDLASESFEFSRFKSDLLLYPSALQTGEHAIKLENYLPLQEDAATLSEAVLKDEQTAKDLADWAKRFPKIEILPQSTFSLLKFLEENNVTYNEQSLGAVASTIYKAVMPTNFTFAERHIGRNLPGYAEAGFEAKVSEEKNMDLIIANPNDQKYTLEFSYQDSLFYTALKGRSLIYSYKIQLKDKEAFKPKKIIQYDAKLRFGEQRTAVEGVDGMLIKVYRDTVDRDGSIIKTEPISEDFYPPVHTVIIHSLTVKESANLNNGGSVQENSGQTAGSLPEEQNGTAGDPENSSENAESGEENSGSQSGEEPSGSQSGEESSQSDQEKEDDGLWGKPNEAAK
ncbi:VanW family protein [Bacillus infantis]|uniref:G5 domain-containing protein n=1 Tax=Bacillus infantis TaxID=324767 RepID=UPI001CD51888|nr:G5 domain-containing protein [Bacillus infantis]MCA1038938.1 VanW family protein [Bacillus infantis]